MLRQLIFKERIWIWLNLFIKKKQVYYKNKNQKKFTKKKILDIFFSFYWNILDILDGIKNLFILKIFYLSYHSEYLSFFLSLSLQ